MTTTQRITLGHENLETRNAARRIYRKLRQVRGFSREMARQYVGDLVR